MNQGDPKPQPADPQKEWRNARIKDLIEKYNGSDFVREYKEFLPEYVSDFQNGKISQQELLDTLKELGNKYEQAMSHR